MRNYLFPRLVCPPDLNSTGVGRRRLCSCSGDCRALAEVGAGSERASGAFWAIGRMLWSPEKNLEFLGSQVAAGGGGPCLLLVRWSEALREVAGGLESRSGWLGYGSRECGGDLEGWPISGQ